MITTPPFWGAVGVLFTLLLFLSHFLHSQDAVNTLYQFSPLRYQPAAPVLDHEASISFLSEELHISPVSDVTSYAFNADLPIVDKKSGNIPLGVGLAFNQRDFGQSDMLKSTELNLSLASTVRISPSQSLSLGLAGSFVHKRTSLEQMATGSQWMAEEFRYDPNANLGEVFAQNQVNYLSLASGLFWRLSAQGRERAFVSLSAFNLNQPNESFFEEDIEIPVSILAMTGTTLVRTDRLLVKPAVVYQRTGLTDLYQLLTSISILFENSNPYDLLNSGSIEFLVNATSGHEMGFGLVIHQPNYRIAGGYQLPIARTTFYQNKFQIGIGLDFLTWQKPRQSITISKPETRSFVFTDDRPPAVKKKSEIDLLEEKLQELGDVKSLQFELAKDFQFLHGSAELIGKKDPFLKDLETLLKAHPNFQLQIVGHTDDMGSHHENLALSRARAKAVADYLIENEVPEAQIQTIGMGDTQPLEKGYTEAIKARNRRVEFIISIDQ